MDTANLVRQAREAAGLSQAELARRAGTSQPAVARYESGVSSPSVRTLERLVHAAGRRLHMSTAPAGVAANLDGDRMRNLRAARPLIISAVRRAGASNLRVFGSVARGEDLPASDIDLLVDFDARTHGAMALIRLRRELSDLLDERVDIATIDLLRPEVATRALAEAVPL
ncbi:MAG TPA: helix-turn-helix domain-containing protein [Actinokineospora sp.]|jgi:predicted nucleotidyltransferase/DNA-binding XRE family transcriptional regulator|nr:helix-turn-helix domain-containing protein [Actinokineospora sp.]